MVINDWKSQWCSEQREAWSKLKTELCNPEILVSLIGGKLKKVMSESSSYEVGGVLMELDNESGWIPVVRSSRQISAADMAYPVYQKSCLAVVHNLMKWGKYLHGERFPVVTDQLYLKWVMNLKEPRDRFARWLMEIQDFGSMWCMYQDHSQWYLTPSAGRR